MCTRVIASALLLSAILMAPGTVMGGGDEGGAVSPIERECQFQVEIPVILSVGPCVPSDEKEDAATISVLANTRTTVCFDSTDFKRNERDCDGNLLDTVDSIPGLLQVNFREIVHCPDGGAELEVKPLENGCWCVNPHRGGYVIELKLRSDAAIDLCDDAGCYTAEVTVTVTAEPFEECP